MPTGSRAAAAQVADPVEEAAPRCEAGADSLIRQSSLRSHRLRLGVGTSLATKVAGAMAQLIGLPLIHSALGEAGFAAFLAITALGMWASPFGFGVLPAVTQQVAVARAEGERGRERAIVGFGFWFCLSVSVGIVIVLLALLAGFDVRILVGVEDELGLPEVQVAFAAAFGVIAVQFLGSLSAAVRAGYQQIHISNLLSLVGNLTILAAVISLSRGQPSIAGLILALYAPIACLQLADLGWLFFRNRHLAPPELPRASELRHGRLASMWNMSRSAWALQLHNFMVTQFSVVLVAVWFTVSDTASYGAAMRLVLLAYSAANLVLLPMLPALSDAASRGDAAWFRRSRNWLLQSALLVTASAALGYGIFGPRLMQLWLGPELHWSTLMCAGFAIFFFAHSMTYVLFNILLAKGRVAGLGRFFLIEIALAVVLAIALGPPLGAAGVALAIGIASFGTLLAIAGTRFRQLAG